MAPDQVWQAPDGQLYSVGYLFNGRATLYRATADGKVLNKSYHVTESAAKMRESWRLVYE